MSLIIPANSAAASGGYAVDNSLRFNSAKLTRTTSSAGNNTKGTFSAWVKRSALGSNQNLILFYTSSGYHNIYFRDTNEIRIYANTSGGTTELYTNRLFRDVSAWLHIVVAYDSTQGTASNRVKLYINGVQETSFATANYPAQNANMNMNLNSEAVSLAVLNASDWYYNGYMAEVVWIDGTQYDASNFGEFDEDSGIWKPIDVSGLTFGTNGFYLEFKESGTGTNASGMGADTSGNTNHFAVNNLTAIDQSTDTCTNNFATLNSLANYFANASFSDGNLTISTTTSDNESVSSTFGVSQGKWYAEYKYISNSGNNRYMQGLYGDTASDEPIGALTTSYGYFAETGEKYNGGSLSSYGNSFSPGDIIGMAVDLDNNYLYFSKNGTWQNSGNPESGATGTGAAFSLPASSTTPSGNYFFFTGDGSGGGSAVVSCNFGSPSFAISSGNTDGNGYGNFEYAVPSGYYALNTKNLSEYG